MPRNISFALTTPQFIAGTKDVTRRMGWEHVKPGDVLMACEKCMGLGRGGKINRLGLIRIVDVRRERLYRMIHQARYGIEEACREGFPDWNGMQFVEFYCAANKCSEHDEVTRLEFVKL